MITLLESVDVRPSTVIAVDVGGTMVKGALVRGGAIVARAERSTFHHAAGAMSTIELVVDELLFTSDMAGSRATSIGVACPGSVHAGSGRVRNAVNLGWEDEPVAERLRATFSLPVAIDHDARAAALAAGASAGLDRPDTGPAVFIPIGTGISASLLLDGVPLTGASGRAGEFGHMRVVPQGELCACGQHGCLEAYASAGGIGRRYRAAGGSALLTTEQIVSARAHDAVAQRVWDEAIDALATGITAVTALFDPLCILLGGGLSRAGDALLLPVREAVGRSLAWRPLPSIQISALGPDAGLLGAALLTRALRTTSQNQEMT
ncbi:ROK family protein [Microbacterium oryzae]|uniref:ROK family protein n=1 Tax=Microbacterium oryzae TaxID=743009 RepID=UPI0025B155DA|nr:ROK family protein [Microbacterium oryzae]MDN3311710.1 ROK family protein [Microbacterium oryzae]